MKRLVVQTTQGLRDFVIQSPRVIAIGDVHFVKSFGLLFGKPGSGRGGDGFPLRVGPLIVFELRFEIGQQKFLLRPLGGERLTKFRVFAQKLCLLVRDSANIAADDNQPLGGTIIGGIAQGYLLFAQVLLVAGQAAEKDHPKRTLRRGGMSRWK